MMAVYAKPKHYAYEVYSSIKYKGVLREQLPYAVELERNGMPVPWVTWCSNHLSDPWGWWFDKDSFAVVGFSNAEDMVLFKLLCSTTSK